MRRPLWIRLKVFLSTLSLRRATGIIGVFQAVEVNFYPRSPCGERPGAERLPPPRWYFYPRSPCGERLEYDPDDNIFVDFYPRSPCGERRGGLWWIWGQNKISIHALLAESDVGCRFTTSGCSNFYPRSPCGERLVQQLFDFALCLNFYPRSPCGERHPDAGGI